MCSAVLLRRASAKNVSNTSGIGEVPNDLKLLGQSHIYLHVKLYLDVMLPSDTVCKYCAIHF